MPTQIWYGVDPGAQGAIAHILRDPKGQLKAGVSKLPYTQSVLDVIALRDIVTNVEDGISGEVHRVFYVEEQTYTKAFRDQKSKSQGQSGQFQKGLNYGRLTAALSLLYGDFVEVSARSWQHSIGCVARGRPTATQKKELNLQVCKQRNAQRFPDLKIMKYNCDAILIADYANGQRPLLG